MSYSVSDIWCKLRATDGWIEPWYVSINHLMDGHGAALSSFQTIPGLWHLTTAINTQRFSEFRH